MPATIFEPLSSPPIYPTDASQLESYIYDAIYTASNGTLNDFSDHSPISAIAQGYIWGMLELLWYASNSLNAAGIDFLRIAGIQRRLGKKAEVTVIFSITPIANPFVLFKNYLISDTAGHEFLTDEDLIIPAGSYSGTVKATAVAMGSSHNVPPYSITNLSVARSFLVGVTNLEPASGGLDEETMEEARARGFQKMRRREVLISADDYEQFAMERLGEGAIAVCFGNLDADKVSVKYGTAHVFCLNPDGTEPSPTQLNDLRLEMVKQSPVGLHNIYCSPVDLYPLELSAIAALIPGSNPQTVATQIYQNLQQYLLPGNLPLGQTIILKELENIVRQSGVEYIQSVSSLVTNNTEVTVSYANIPLPQKYTAAYLLGLHIKLVDEQISIAYEFDFGGGGDLD